MMNQPFGGDSADFNVPEFPNPEQPDLPLLDPPSADPMTLLAPTILLSEPEQAEIVGLCNRFKKSVQRHAGAKKELMRKCFGYVKNKLQADDLLPTPASSGSDRDNASGRPQVFVPLCRQQLKTILSQLKLTLFPNDEDYFRVRAKFPEGVALEDALTEALKYQFKEAQISEKIGAALYDIVWSGCFAAFPTIKEEINWEWRIDPFTGAYVPTPVQEAPVPTLMTFNPLNFYVDPVATDFKRTKWMYATEMKVQELLDSNLYFNKENIQGLGSTWVNKASQNQKYTLDDLNDLSSTYEDTEANIQYDLYYFPYLKTSTREYRNMMIGVAAEKVLVRFHPNLFPKGMNPVVFCNWMHDTDNPYGMGPIEDIKDLQKIINMLYNYQLEVAARSGNRFAISPSVDVTNFWGVAGGMMVTENPGGDIVPLHGDFQEIATIQNMIGVAKAEAQMTAGSQNPFQGASNVDFRKTATELQIIQENSISILREVIEHISILGIQPILERLMLLCAELYSEPVLVRVETEAGPQYRAVDLSILKSGQFTIEVVGSNPSQSKQAQFNGLMQLLQMISEKPEMLHVVEPLIRKMGTLQGIKDIAHLLQDIQSRLSPSTP